MKQENQRHVEEFPQSWIQTNFGGFLYELDKFLHQIGNDNVVFDNDSCQNDVDELQ